MTTDNYCFDLKNRLIQTSQTGGQWDSDTSHLVVPGGACRGKLGIYMMTKEKKKKNDCEPYKISVLMRQDQF
jgi:hypothetical protein